MNEKLAAAIAALETTLQQRFRLMDDTLKALNNQLPFVGFQPSLSQSVYVYLAANTERTVTLLDRTQAVRFGYSASPLYVSLMGRVHLPTAAGDTNDNQSRGLIVNPEGWYYAAGSRQLSLLAPAATIVSIHCHVQL